MRTFDEIWAIAAARKGGDDALEAMLPVMKSPDELAAIGDDRILSMMTRMVFCAGFNWKVIEHKWAGFEEAFEGFDPARWHFMSDDDLDSLLKDTRIVRNGPKILTVRDNASFVLDLADRYGSAARAIAQWPASDFIGLLDLLKKGGSRLGGNTGPYFLRFLGKDGFVISQDVTAALIREGVVDKAPTGKAAMKAVQQAFDTWQAESGRPLAHISRTLSYSVGV
ncbi:MAG: 3-methyladenine DNA glycosylase [Alphaproteobacteria bacterium]|nr:MAG: 3-methyladenine DNA glycosylase [Alphaproteobacteria bacterium]